MKSNPLNFEQTASASDMPVRETEQRSWTLLSRSFPLTLLVGALLALSLTLLFFMSVNRFFDHDEFEAMHTTWKMYQGQDIYTDFIQHHHPFMYYTLLPLYALFGSTTDVLIAARVFIFFQLVSLAQRPRQPQLGEVLTRFTASMDCSFTSHPKATRGIVSLRYVGSDINDPLRTWGSPVKPRHCPATVKVRIPALRANVPPCERQGRARRVHV